jgi:hypothetical protein
MGYRLSTLGAIQLAIACIVSALLIVFFSLNAVRGDKKISVVRSDFPFDIPYDGGRGAF